MHTSIPANANAAPYFVALLGTFLATGGCSVPNAQPAGPCAAKPCYPSVTCTADAAAADGFICGPCPVGYEGDGTTCAPAKRCSPNPCKNGGSCTEMPLGLICACTVGWAGPTCEACVATKGGAEVCDGLDNNCDGRPDEGFDLGSDAANCGGCGNDCATDAGLWADFGGQLPQHAAQVGCSGGACVVTGCQVGWRDDPATAFGDCAPPPGCDGPLVFADWYLEVKVREAIAKLTGDVLFADVAGLQSLDALGENIGSLSGIQCLTSLTDLNLGFNQVSDLAALSGLTSLTTLALDGNQISDIAALSALTSLTTLALDDNQISDIAALSALTSLNELSLFNNQISDITALSALTSLTELSLFNNQISDITALSALTSLTDLSLGSNQVSDLSALSGLTRLDRLRLWENQISDIAALSALTGLTYLDLAFNQVSDVSALSGLTNLTNLFLSFNQISIISPLVSNAGLDSDDSVFLRYNPLVCSNPQTQSDIAALRARDVFLSTDCP